MGLPLIGKAASAFMSPAAQVGGWALMGGMSVWSYRERVRSGENPLSAGTKEAGMFALGGLMSGPAAFGLFFGLPLARAGSSMLLGAYNHQTNFVRQMRTPFSHRFEHSEVTARAQMQGLQAIGASWAHRHMGSEAAAFARRYGR